MRSDAFIHCLLYFITGIVCFSLCQETSEAGGPLLVSKTGVPFKWNTQSPVRFSPDKGSLGKLSNKDAVELTDNSFRVWEAVPTSTIRFEQGSSLSIDVTGNNIMSFLNTLPSDINPIIFDTNGSVTVAILGQSARNHILGFAKPLQRNSSTLEISQAWAVLNGAFIDGKRNPRDVTRDRFIHVIVHEIGHFIGLDHAQINVVEGLDNNENNDVDVPMMFPILPLLDKLLNLNPDDRAALSALYPSSTLASSTGTIRGKVLLPDGTTGFQGANVIARRADDPKFRAYSSVSGFLHTGTRSGNDFGSTNTNLLGFYEIPGLSPGKYTIEVEEIHSDFTGASAVGPLNPPVVLFGPPEFYSGRLESQQESTDVVEEVTVVAGSVINNVNIIIDDLISGLWRGPYLNLVTIGNPPGCKDLTGTIVTAEFNLALQERSVVGTIQYSDLWCRENLRGTFDGERLRFNSSNADSRCEDCTSCIDTPIPDTVLTVSKDRMRGITPVTRRFLCLLLPTDQCCYGFGGYDLTRESSSAQLSESDVRSLLTFSQSARTQGARTLRSK